MQAGGVPRRRFGRGTGEYAAEDEDRREGADTRTC